MSHAPTGGQAPDQANSGRQTGAALLLGQIIPKAHPTAASHPTSHKQQHDTRLATNPDRPAHRVSQSPELLVIVCASMDPFPIRWCLLEDADDEELLRALTYAHTVNDGRPWGGTRRWRPERTVAEIRPELIALIREGHVELYKRERSPNESIAVDPEAALAVVADDANWNVPAESGRDVVYALRLTASGEQEAQRFFGSG